SDLFFELDAGSAFTDPASYPFRRLRTRTDDTQEDIHAVKADLRFDMEFGDNPGYLKFGVKYSRRDKFWDRTNQNFTGAVDFTLADTGLWSPGPDDFHEGRYVLRPVLDFEAHEALFRNSPELFELDAESSAIDSIATDYDIREELT